MKSIFILTAVLLSAFCALADDNAAAKPAAYLGMDYLAKVMLEYLDTNGDGIIDHGEFTTGTEKGYSDLDHDSDGFITKAEMDAAGTSMAQEASSEFLGKASSFLLSNLLLTMDDNKDGQISKAEFTKGCETMFKKLDANQDGQLSRDELLALPTRLLGK